MSKIQLVLLIAIILLLIQYVRFFKDRLFNLVIFLSFFVLGIVFVIQPAIAQQVASFFGVGRGVDVVIYFLLIAFFFLFIAVFHKTRHLGKTINELVRNRAIENAKKLGDS